MTYINKKIKIYLVLILSFLVSCTYDYQYPTDLSSKYHIVDVDDGFHGMTLDILKQYGASIIYYNREKTISEYDGNGTELRTIKMDLKFVDTFMSSNGAAYIVIKVAMNRGEMGYVCTDPIRLNFGQNEITLDENTPVHVELTNKK